MPGNTTHTQRTAIIRARAGSAGKKAVRLRESKSCVGAGRFPGFRTDGARIPKQTLTIDQENVESARRRLAADGFVVLPAVIDPDALGRLRDRVALFYRAWERYPASTRKEIASPAGGGDYLPVREINWPAAALQLLNQEPAVIQVSRVVDALVGERCRLIHANSLLKPAARGAPVAPHQDTAYNVQRLDRPLTAWVPFDEVSKDNGALYYLPGSHDLGPLAHASEGGVRWLDEPRLSPRNETGWRTYSGEPGSIGVHDSRVVHGSHPNRSARDRLALSLRFAVAVGSGGRTMPTH